MGRRVMMEEEMGVEEVAMCLRWSPLDRDRVSSSMVH